jgi:hypothetical protein
LTFADDAEKVRDGESGRSRVAITDLGKVPAERQHPKPVYCRCRPQAEAQTTELDYAKLSFDIGLQL